MKKTIDLELENIALEGIVMQAVFHAGISIKELAYSDLNTQWKKKDDPVTILDKIAEQKIIKSIESHGVKATFYGEEFGIKKGNSKIKIYIDPIDGTKSFIKKEFHSSTSVALEKNGELVLGFVYDFMKNIMYYANVNGAYLIAPHGQSFKLPLQKMPQFSKPNIEVTEIDNKYTKNIDCRVRQQTGSVALSMAELAAGSNNGLVMVPYRKNGVTDTCDIAAGYFIMKKAGLFIRDYDFKPYDYRQPNNGLIALDPRAEEAMATLTK